MTSGTLLARADEHRLGFDAVTPGELWRMADALSRGTVAARIGLYRHALIHVGRLRPTQEVCDFCGERLR